MLHVSFWFIWICPNTLQSVKLMMCPCSASQFHGWLLHVRCSWVSWFYETLSKFCSSKFNLGCMLFQRTFMFSVMLFLVLFFTENNELKIFCMWHVGFGDACYQTQLFAIFGSVYADKSAAAFAIFKFTQSAASAIAFFSSSYMGMLSQMLTLLISAILGFLGVFIVEMQTKRRSRSSESENNSSSGSTASCQGESGETRPVVTSSNVESTGRDKQQKVV